MSLHIAKMCIFNWIRFLFSTTCLTFSWFAISSFYGANFNRTKSLLYSNLSLVRFFPIIAMVVVLVILDSDDLGNLTRKIGWNKKASIYLFINNANFYQNWRFFKLAWNLEKYKTQKPEFRLPTPSLHNIQTKD